MKSVYSFSCTSMLVAACLFCGCSRENAKAPGSGASAPKSYEPLVGTNAFAVAVCDDRKAHSNQPLLAFCDLVGKKSREITDAISAEFPDKVSEKLAKYYGMSCDDAIRHFYGVEPSDIKWRVCALEKFDPAAIAEGYPTNFVAPHLYAAVHSARPLDLDKIVAAYREFFEALRDPGSEASNAVAQAYGECEKYVSCERLEIGGAPAYRLSLTDPESGEKINGISPLATTICGGNLLVFAISDATLAHVKGLYAGTEPSAPADSAMGRELAIPDDILFRVAVTDIDKFVPALGKDGDGDDGDDGEDGSDLDNLVGARLGGFRLGQDQPVHSRRRGFPRGRRCRKDSPGGPGEDCRIDDVRPDDALNEAGIRLCRADSTDASGRERRRHALHGIVDSIFRD